LVEGTLIRFQSLVNYICGSGLVARAHKTRQPCRFLSPPPPHSKVHDGKRNRSDREFPGPLDKGQGFVDLAPK